jgi:hypothetical protein
MLQFTPNMINNFPGSDDSRGTTTRIYYSIPQPVTENRSPEMRPDEVPGTLGEAFAQYNLTRQTISFSIPTTGLDTATSLNGVYGSEKQVLFNDSILSIATSRS